MTHASPQLLEVVRHLLTVEAGGGISSSEQGITIAKQLHGRLMQVVAPLLGEAGFDGLFARSLKRIKPGFPSLRDLETTGVTHQEALSRFFENLETQEAGVMQEIIVASIANFISLLSMFIGKGLTWKIMLNAWPDALPSEPPPGEAP